MITLPNLRNYFTKRAGFTLVELLIVMGIMAVLLGLIIVNTPRTIKKSYLDSSVDQLVSDIKGQQLKAMQGASENNSSLNGIHFTPADYNLFNGAAFVPTGPSNFTTTLQGGFVLSTTFPNANIIFATASGEIINFNSSQNAITVTDNLGQQKTITINSYGTIVSIN